VSWQADRSPRVRLANQGWAIEHRPRRIQLHRPNTVSNPKLQLIRPSSIMTPNTGRSRCCSKVGCQRTTWTPSPSSTIENRPGNRRQQQTSGAGSSAYNHSGCSEDCCIQRQCAQPSRDLNRRSGRASDGWYVLLRIHDVEYRLCWESCMSQARVTQPSCPSTTTSRFASMPRADSSARSTGAPPVPPFMNCPHSVDRD
jgi:hypothetical protein